MFVCQQQFRTCLVDNGGDMAQEVVPLTEAYRRRTNRNWYHAHQNRPEEAVDELQGVVKNQPQSVTLA